MSRITLPRRFFVCGLLGLAGCAHIVEKDAIRAFTTAMVSEDFDQLRTATSDEFEHRALRTAEALDDLKILNLPKGETSVVEVQDESDAEKLVTVTVGKTNKKVFYRLTKDDEAKHWVVDDVYVRQRKDGVKVDKSVAEQMDLLLSVRELLTAWDSGTREEVLSVATPELEAVLRELPPTHLSRLCKSVVAEHVQDDRFHPRAQLDSDVAVVTLPRKTGKMVLSYKLLNGQWRVSDVAVESKKDQEHIPSVMKTASVMRAAIKFLDAYAAEDKERLKAVCLAKFYEGSLLPGDLTTVSLPNHLLSQGQFHVKMEGSRADFVIEQEQQVTKIGLTRESLDNPIEKITTYLIDDVTLYQTHPQTGELQEKRLSMVFTGHAVMQLFRESLAAGNVPLLRKTATHDFNRRVWHHVEESSIDEFTPRLMKEPIEKTLSAEYDGAISKLTVRQMGVPVTYVLRDRSGEVGVDDVIVNQPDQVASMKDTLELMIPLRIFREALVQANLDTLQRSSSSDLNRMIWKQADDVPAAGQQAVEHLKAPFSHVEKIDEGKTLITLGDERFGCKVLLVEEHDQRVVDEIVLITGTQPEERALLKRTMREQLALGVPASTPTFPSPVSRQEVLPASHWEDGSPPLKSASMTEEALPLRPVAEDKVNLVPVPEPTAPPLFPGGEADLEFAPEIVPSENAFDSPPLQSSDSSGF